MYECACVCLWTSRMLQQLDWHVCTGSSQLKWEESYYFKSTPSPGAVAFRLSSQTLTSTGNDARSRVSASNQQWHAQLHPAASGAQKAIVSHQCATSQWLDPTIMWHWPAGDSAAVPAARRLLKVPTEGSSAPLPPAACRPRIAVAAVPAQQQRHRRGQRQRRPSGPCCEAACARIGMWALCQQYQQPNRRIWGFGPYKVQQCKFSMARRRAMECRVY